MRTRLKPFVLCGALLLAVVGCVTAVAIGLRAYRAVTVRQPNAYAMQSAGQLIVEHLRHHSGAWPRSWAELRDTCATAGTMILGADADAEIEELSADGQKGPGRIESGPF